MSKLVKCGELSVYIDAPEELKEEALGFLALVSRVTTDEEAQRATEALKSWAEYFNHVEASRVAIRAPFNALMAEIQKVFYADVTPGVEMSKRVQKLVSDYMQLKIANVRSEEASRRESLSELERARESELAKTETMEEREAIQERY